MSCGALLYLRTIIRKQSIAMSTINIGSTRWQGSQMFINIIVGNHNILINVHSLITKISSTTVNADHIHLQSHC